PVWSTNQMAQWMAHPWPGNVRELKNVADRLCLGLEAHQSPTPDNGSHRPSLGQQMDNFERQLLTQALTHCQGQVALAAEELNVPRKTLYDKLARHAIDPARYRTTS
ncbi:MAG TPA: helix-turn-helix domain-containing protein, partial [Hydrogenophaga sp.]